MEAEVPYATTARDDHVNRQQIRMIMHAYATCGWIWQYAVAPRAVRNTIHVSTLDIMPWHDMAISYQYNRNLLACFICAVLH